MVKIVMLTMAIDASSNNDQVNQTSASISWTMSMEESYSHQWQMKQKSKLKHDLSKNTEHKPKPKETNDDNDKVSSNDRTSINKLTPVPITFFPGPTMLYVVEGRMYCNIRVIVDIVR